MNKPRILSTDAELTQPVFKFQEKAHADAMMTHGNIHLSNLADFRDTSHPGQIHDPREGQIKIIEAEKGVETGKVIGDYSLERAYAFCSSHNFLSESLKWALDEGKDSCVLITDIQEVANRITSTLPELTFIGGHPCRYTGRDLAFTPEDVQIGLKDQTHFTMLAAFTKLKEYERQMEFRLVWGDNKNTIKENYLNKNYDISQFMIPVLFDGMNKLFSSKAIHKIIVSVKTVNDPPSFFELLYPKEVCSPLIRKDNDRYLLGFSVPGSVSFDRVHMHASNSTGLIFTGDDNSALNVPLDKVEYIEYTCA